MNTSDTKKQSTEKPAAAAPQKTESPSGSPFKVSIAQRKTGKYEGTVLSTRLFVTGDKPVIFTAIKLSEEFHVTHVVRLRTNDPAKSAQAMRIGFEELRRAFPNQLALISDEALLEAMETNKLMGLPVKVEIVQQMKNNLPVRIPNADGSPGELAFNVRLEPAQPMSEEVRKALFKNVLSPLNAVKKATSAFETASSANRAA